MKKFIMINNIFHGKYFNIFILIFLFFKLRLTLHD